MDVKTCDLSCLISNGATYAIRDVPKTSRARFILITAKRVLKKIPNNRLNMLHFCGREASKAETCKFGATKKNRIFYLHKSEYLSGGRWIYLFSLFSALMGSISFKLDSCRKKWSKTCCYDGFFIWCRERNITVCKCSILMSTKNKKSSYFSESLICKVNNIKHP